MLNFALLMTLRDWRAGELRFLMAALALAVASLSAVQFFTGRIGTGLRRDAHQFLAADLRVAQNGTLDPAWVAEARLRGLQHAATLDMPSMALSGDGDAALSQLVMLKAVSPGYPLRGSMRLRSGAGEVAQAGGPPAGTAWVDPGLLHQLQLKPGDSLRLGETRLVISGVIAAEPDRPGVVSMAPRLMMAQADLAATGLLHDGTFANQALLVAGQQSVVDGYGVWLKTQLARTGRPAARVETLASTGAKLNEGLERAEGFLSLVGLLSAFLASVAVAMAARRYTERHADATAMLRCLGLPQGRITLLYLIEFLAVGLLASAIGVACGYAAHFVLIEWLGSLLTTALPPAGAGPVAAGMGVGVALLIGFGLPPLLQLRNVSHNRLLRREANPVQRGTLLAYAVGAVVFGALLLWSASDLQIGLLMAAAFGGGLALFAGAAWLALQSLRQVPAWLDRGVMRMALAGVRRRPGAALTQVVALALGLMALMLLTMVRGDLLDAWRKSADAGDTNHVIEKIEAHQRDAVEARLRSYGKPVLYPVIQARIAGINGKPADPAAYADPAAKRMLSSEREVSAAAVLPAKETLVAGAWFAKGANAHELSLSEKAAARLQLKLGDQVELEVAGMRRTLTLTSLRKPAEGNGPAMPSFMLSPAAAAGLPATYSVNLFVPSSDRQFMTRLASEFPNLMIFNVGAMMDKLREVLDQVSAAIEFLFLFTLASGVMVMAATLLASQDERVRQAAIVRALGASRSQLQRAQQIECAVIGALAGVLAASGALAAGFLLARHVFKLEWHFSPLLLAAGLGAGIACSMAGGAAGLRAVLKHPPLHVLRTN